MKFLILCLLILAFFTGRAGENRNDLKAYTIEAGDVKEMRAEKFSQNKHLTQTSDFTVVNNEMAFSDHKRNEEILSNPDTCDAPGQKNTNSSSDQKSNRGSRMNPSANNKSFNIYVSINALCY